MIQAHIGNRRNTAYWASSSHKIQMDFTLPIIISIHVYIRQLLSCSMIELLERNKKKIDFGKCS